MMENHCFLLYNSFGDVMKYEYNSLKYEIVIIRKKTTRNTYIRVKDDLVIYVTTNIFMKDKDIENIIIKNQLSINKMIDRTISKKSKKQDFYYLGVKRDIIYTNINSVILGENNILINRNTDIDKWLKEKALEIFKEHLDMMYKNFPRRIPYPLLKIRKMTSRWGVCNVKNKTVTLNLELMKMDLKYLDYVINHELSHLVYPNHSTKFWDLVEEVVPNYKLIKKEMRDR